MREGRYVDDEVERKLLNWQRWKLGDSGNPLGSARSQMDREVIGGHRESHIPIMAGEARDVNDAVATLSARYRVAITQEYLCPEKTQGQRATFMGVSVRTFCRNVDEGKIAIAQFLREMRRRTRAAALVAKSPPRA